MASAQEPLTLTPDQVRQIGLALSECRHNLNNKLAMIAAVGEVIRLKPNMSERMLASIEEQIPKMQQEIATFSQMLETLLGIEPGGQ